MAELPLTPPATVEEISEDEQWRLINETGVLHQISPTPKTSKIEPQKSFGDEVFSAVTLIIPMSFLYLLMDILVHQQYARHPTFLGEVRKLAEVVPMLAVFIFYTNRHKARRWLQAVLTAISMACGMRLFWVVNKGSWMTIMQQAPPLSTAWIYTIIQLNLLPTVLSIASVGAFVWWRELKYLP